MARDKEKTVNPATAALKSQKNASIKKQKAAVAAQRTERLANRNPDRLQKQLDELLALKDSSGGKLRPKDQQTLQGLERDLRLINKAKQSDPAFGRTDARPPRRDADAPDGQRQQHLGKRRRGSRDADARGRASDSEDTDPEARRIPMPRDTPPPVPRRPGRHAKNAQQDDDGKTTTQKQEHQTSYEAAPQLRDLRAEAAGAFMPAAVAARARARPRMLEPEEADAREAAQARRLDEAEAAFRAEVGADGLHQARVEDAEEDEDEASRLGGVVDGPVLREVEDQQMGEPERHAAGAEAEEEEMEVVEEEERDEGEGVGGDVFSWD